MIDLQKETLWSRINTPGDTLGVSCDENGPSIGPVRLLKRTPHGLKPRFSRELDFIFSSALGRSVDFAGSVRGLEAVANALEKGDLAKAILITQFLWLPSLPDEEAFERAVQADTLAKSGFSTGELRDERGRWTTGDLSVGQNATDVRDASGIVPTQELIFPDTLIPWLEGVRPTKPLPETPPFPGEILPPIAGNPDIAVPRTLENPYPNDRRCTEEWRKAKEYCGDLKDKGLLGSDGYKGMGKRFAQCVRGQISARCGGNPIA